MHCSFALKPNSAFCSLQGLLSGPVAIVTLWQNIARISCNGSPDTVHSAPVEEFHSPEETKGTVVLTRPDLQITVYLALHLCSDWRMMRICSLSFVIKGDQVIHWRDG